MNILLGRNADLALYGNDSYAVVLNTEVNLIVASGSSQGLMSFSDWQSPRETLNEGQLRLCDLALETYESQEFAADSGRRMYSIPDGVQREAKKALEWRKEYKRGGTSVGLNTARTLARGGQIGIQKIRHIAKYFPRHEVDKQGKGWDPGEDGYPSNGKIAWALWGGDAARRWASAIVERENKKEKSMRASGYADSFKAAYELEEDYGPEFMARVHMDGSGIDRLYKIEADGQTYIWDDNIWDDMGDADANIWRYDYDLDENESPECTHVLIDVDSAMLIAAKLAMDPSAKITISEIDEEEQRLAELGLPEEDWELVDRVMALGGDSMIAAGTAADQDGDGKLDPEFLSEKATKQPRNADGEFVKVGSRTVVAGDRARGSGVLESIDYATGKVKVRLDSGKTISVPVEYTQAEKNVDGPMMAPGTTAPIDFSGILGEPRTPRNMPKAHLPGTLKPMTSKNLGDLINNYPKYVANLRKSFKPLNAGAEKQADAINSPKESDVPPKYLAIVSPDDVQAVMDLVAIVPASKTSTEPTTYRRQDKKWVPDPQVLDDLKSPAPPPVVQLDKNVLNDVLIEVDNVEAKAQGITAAVMRVWFAASGDINKAILAAGGLDRNRGNAEALRRYWTRGKGALKIRWGTPGDWTRCVRQLSKYLGPRAKGYCQLRHKEVTGVYTGSKYNVGKKRGLKSSAGLNFTSEEQFTKAMIEKAELSAKYEEIKQKVALIAAAPPVKSGATFSIPMLVPEEVESGDGRKFKKGAIAVRDLPVPLLWQIKTGAGHDGSVVVGRIDYIERVEGGMGNAYGVFDTGPYGKEAERLVRHGFLRGVSVDLDQFEAKEEKKPKEEMAEDDAQEIGKDKLTINKARIMAATIVAKPAFQECSILLQNEGDQEENVTPEDGIYEESLEDFSDVEPIVASGFLKSEIPMTPPAQWFTDPKLAGPTPLTVDEDGRVYGHIAAWNVNHIGLPRATKPPRSRTKYAYFHTGVIRTDAGTDVPVGQLTLAGGHAPLNADAASAARHYDDTASAVADIHVGEDKYGIWCAGSLRPKLDEMQIRALRASAPSGDWRPINGSLELVAICQVNVPGFPTARAMIASGKVLALVAAGASYLAMIKCSGAACSLNTKAKMLGELAATAPDLKSRVKDAKKRMREANLQSLTASAEKMREKAALTAALAAMASISQEEREALAKEGKAMPDGAYPIRNVEDLKNAIQAYGRSKASERRAVRKHIMKQARKLNQWKLIPEHWKEMATAELQRKAFAMRKSITAAANELRDYSEETREKYSKKGLALPDGSFPIENEADLKRAIKAHGRAKDIEKAKRHIKKRARALGREDLIPEEWSAKTASVEAVVAAPKAQEISDEELEKLRKAKEEADKQTEEEIKAAEEVKANKGKPVKVDEDGRPKYISGVNQPRDAKGKYRKVLARLKQDLGVAGLAKALKKVEEAENLDFAGDYAKSAKASSELLDMIDRIDAKALNPESLENVRLSAAELGKTIANLPLPFGKESSKLRFSDLPVGLKDLIEQMITRVEAKIGKKDADIATQSLRSYMSGADVYSQGEIQSEMSKLLRLLT